jgi:hypothetical protein
MNNTDTSNSIYILFNGISVAVAIGMLTLSIWLAPVDLSTKGYWGMGILFLVGALVNLVKYRVEERFSREAVSRLENAKNEKLIKDYVAGTV